MRTTSFLMLLAGLAVPAAMAQQRPDALTGAPPSGVHDHYDPVLLNEFAIDRIRQHDLTTAWILLERAALLAPHDQRIHSNLRELEMYRMGKPAPAEIAAPVVRQSPGQGIAAEPPPIWPLR